MKSKRYFGLWDNYDDVLQSAGGMAWDYNKGAYVSISEGLASTFPTDKEILFAIYEYEDYSGGAEILYERDGKLFTIVDSHCSCNGLEDLNSPGTPTSWEALALTLPEAENGGYSSWHDTEADEHLHALIRWHTKKADA